MENKEQIEYVIANLSEKEISDLAMVMLKNLDMKNSQIIDAYAAIKAKIYTRQMECASKLKGKDELDATKIF